MSSFLPAIKGLFWRRLGGNLQCVLRDNLKVVQNIDFGFRPLRVVVQPASYLRSLDEMFPEKLRGLEKYSV